LLIFALHDLHPF